MIWTTVTAEPRPRVHFIHRAHGRSAGPTHGEDRELGLERAWGLSCHRPRGAPALMPPRGERVVMSTQPNDEAAKEAGASPSRKRATWSIDWRAARRAGRPGSGSRRSVPPPRPPCAKVYATATGRCASGAPRSSITTPIPRRFPSCLPLLHDPKSDVRLWAVHSLSCDRCKDEGLNNPIDYVPHLIERIERDESIRVRRMAMVMLTIASRRAGGARVRQDRDRETDRKLRKHAEWGLKRLREVGLVSGRRELDRRAERGSATEPLSLKLDLVPAVGRGEEDMLDSWIKDLRYGLRSLIRRPVVTGGRDPLDRPRRGRQRRRLQPGQRPPAATAARRRRRPTSWCASTSCARASTGRSASRCPTSATRGTRPPRWSRRSAVTPTTSSVSRSTARRRARSRARWWSATTSRRFGAQPALGRFFNRAEDDAHEPVVVLAHDTWRDQLGGDPDAIGRADRARRSDLHRRRRRRARLRRHRDLVRSRPLGPGARGRSSARRARGARLDAVPSHRSPARGRRARAARGAARRALRHARRPSTRHRTKAPCFTPCPTPTRASKPGSAAR